MLLHVMLHWQHVASVEYPVLLKDQVLALHASLEFGVVLKTLKINKFIITTQKCFLFCTVVLGLFPHVGLVTRPSLFRGRT